MLKIVSQEIKIQPKAVKMGIYWEETKYFCIDYIQINTIHTIFFSQELYKIEPQRTQNLKLKNMFAEEY